MNMNVNITIDRPIFEQDDLQQQFDYEKSKDHFIKDVKCKCNPKKCIIETVPLFGWLKHYNWRTDIIADLISGITVAIMHIPQGMAYGLLANLPPVVGIYMAFFPVLIYFFLGTSRHNSMGTFAIVCLMTGKAVVEHSHVANFIPTTSNPIQNLSSIIEEPHYTPIQVATAITITVGLIHLLMYVLRLGILSLLLSESLVSGFTTGAAVQVFASQMKDIFGLTFPRPKGYFVVVSTFVSVFEGFSNVNVAAVIIAAVTLSVGFLNSELLKPFVAKKCSLPIPMELIAVVAGALVSKLANLQEIYNIKVIGEIPSGLPMPEVPTFSIINLIIFDAVAIAMVSYAVSLSMAVIFAQKLNYKVDANQELLALGASNVFGSFFSCVPISASLSRSLIQQTVGGKSQIASLVSCAILFFVLMWIGPFFEPLPKAVLASVILVALKGMLMQMKDFVKFLKLSKLDATVWMITFLAVVFISIDIGLIIGFVLSLMSVLVLSLKPYTCLLGSVPETDLYLDINRYKGCAELPNVKIFHYCGGINFATRSHFTAELLRLIEIDPQKEFLLRQKLVKLSEEIQHAENGNFNQTTKKYNNLRSRQAYNLQCLILDFSAVSHIDPSGASALNLSIKEFQSIDVTVYIAGCSVKNYEVLKKCGLLDGEKKLLKLFPTVHDAVQNNTIILYNDLTRYSLIEN